MASLKYLFLESIDEIILKEIGDGSSKSYNFKRKSFVQYSFIAGLGNNIKEEVAVDFQNLDINQDFKKKLLQNIFIPSDKMYNVGYNIQGNEFQFRKTELRVLLRIISTVVKIIEDFITNINPDLLFVIGTPKKQGGLDSEKKSILYNAFIEKQLNKFSGYSAESRLDGFVIYKDTIRK
jgi:hypothetical protein